MKEIQRMASTSPKSTVITLRLSQDLHGLCKAQADKEEIPVSYVIRRAIRAGLKAETKPVPKSTEVEMPDWE
jgi:predicted transcriptional regulator